MLIYANFNKKWCITNKIKHKNLIFKKNKSKCKNLELSNNTINFYNTKLIFLNLSSNKQKISNYKLNGTQSLKTTELMNFSIMISKILKTKIYWIWWEYQLWTKKLMPLTLKGFLTLFLKPIVILIINYFLNKFYFIFSELHN